MLLCRIINIFNKLITTSLKVVVFHKTSKSYQASNLCTTESKRMFPATEMICDCILCIFLVGSEVGGGGRAVVQGSPVVHRSLRWGHKHLAVTL